MPKVSVLTVAFFLLLAPSEGRPAVHETRANQLAARSPNIRAAISDSPRPAADTARDAERHAAETLAFAGIVPGARVAEILPGGGYFTRLLAVAVGEQGPGDPRVRPEATGCRCEKPAHEGPTR